MVLSAIASITLVACGESGPETGPPPAGLILEIDGMRCFEDELDPLLSYAESVDNRIGRSARISTILDQHLIPLKLAQRAWGPQRGELRRSAEALAAAIGNGGYPELVARSQSTGAGPPRTTMRHELPLPLAAWAFDEQRVGMVSPVIETAQGFSLISSYEIIRGVTRTVDRAEVCQVAFFTHDSVAFAEWLERSRSALIDKVTYVNPDYRGALPPWIKAP